MGWSVFSRAWRAGIIAFGLAWFGAVESRAETPVPAATAPHDTALANDRLFSAKLVPRPRSSTASVEDEIMGELLSVES